MRILVCGGRDFTDFKLMSSAMHHMLVGMGTSEDIIITGGAHGADSMAIQYARTNSIPYMVFMADWNKYGKAAGPVRNQKMLEIGKPEMVLAFPGGRGTEHMCFVAKKHGIKVIQAVDVVREASQGFPSLGRGDAAQPPSSEPEAG